jgi:hypothetical protein
MARKAGVVVEGAGEDAIKAYMAVVIGRRYSRTPLDVVTSHLDGLLIAIASSVRMRNI